MTSEEIIEKIVEHVQWLLPTPHAKLNSKGKHILRGLLRKLVRIAQSEVEEVCEFCGGINGEHEELDSMEQVYAGEPHMAPIGSRPCPNSLPDNEEDYE